MATLKGLTLEIGGEVTPLNKALASVNKTSRDLKGELRDVERLLKLDPKNTELLEQKQKLLGKSVETTKEKLEALKDAEKQVQQQVKEGKASEEQYRALQREIVKTEQEMKRLEDKTKSTSGAMDLLAKNSDKVNNFMQKATYSFIAAGAGLVGMAYKAGQAADDINTLAKQTGLSTEEIQKFKYASEIIDVPLEILTKSMAKLVKGMESARLGSKNQVAAFKDLGVSILDNDGKLRNHHDVFQASIKALGKMENATQRDALAMQIFGKSAQDLNPLILGGAEALEQLSKEAEDAGLILSQDALDGANEFNDAIDKIKATTAGAFGKIGSEIARELIPAVENVAENVVSFMEWFLNHKDTVIKTITVIGAGLLAWNVGKMISSVVLAVQGLSLALTGAAAAQTGLNAAMNANVIGLVLMAVAALGLGIYALIKSQNSEIDQSKKLVEQAEQERQAYERLKQVQEEKAEASLSELAYTEKLWQELQTLADKNGNVTEANQARAQFIMGELNTALGTELQLINGKIQGMQGEQAEIDKLIEKKRAQIYLESLEPAYREAVVQVKQQETEVSAQYQEMLKTESELLKVRGEAAQAQQDHNRQLLSAKMTEEAELEKILKNQERAYLINKNTLDQYYIDINGYEAAAVAATEGNYQKVEEIVVGSTQRTYQTADSLVDKSKDDQIGILGEQYAAALTYLSDYAVKHKKGVEGYTADGLKEAQNYATSAKTEYEKVGGAVVDGTVAGVDGKKHNLKTTIDALFKSIPEWARKILKIESPSKEMRDEVGRYITEGVAQGIIDHNGALKKAAEGMADEVKAQIKTLNDYIETVNDEIKQLQKSKDVSDAAEKKSIDEQIKAKKELIETTRDNIKTLQDEQKQFEETARTYKEAADEINRGLKEKTESINLDEAQSSGTYKLWLAVHENTATEAEKLQKQEENLTDQYNIQGETVEATEAAYELMVEQYGESYEGSRKLYNQLLQEKTAYEELYNSIIGVQKAKSELTDYSTTNLRAAQTSYGDFLAKNYKSLSNFGISASDIFTTARKASGLDKAESAVRSITVNQNITTTAAKPSEIREAARDGAMLATKEAYA